MTANYTRSKCINQGEPGTDIVNSFPDPKDPSTNEGPCAADRPHLFNLSTVAISRGFGDGFWGTLTRDWQLGVVFQARSGAPLTPATTGDSALTGLGNQRPTIVDGVDPNLPSDQRTFVAGGTALQWFNMAAFAQNTPGSWGNVPKGYLRGPAFWNADMAFSRNVRISQHNIELRAEVFNVLNHVNWGAPNVTLGAGTSGQVTTTANDPRIIQLAIKYGF